MTNSNIAQQVHSRFKLFSAVVEDGNSIAKLAEQVEQFATAAKAAPKSIGIEYLEHSKRIVLSLGYRDDETAYPVKLSVVSLGKASKLDGAELQRLESRMAEEAAKLQSIICHELFITEQDEFLMVFMAHQAK